MNGNILSVVKNNATDPEKEYKYENSNWKDLLTEYNDWDITYDAIGNPLQYRNNINLTWVNGRKLESFTKNGATTTFTYDGEGNRIRKASGNTTIRYFYDKTPMLSMENVGVFLLEREKIHYFMLENRGAFFPSVIQ